jgi:hypothetical protein
VTKVPKDILSHDFFKEIWKVTKLPNGRVISAPQQLYKKWGLDIRKGLKIFTNIKEPYFMTFLLDYKSGSFSQHFEKVIVLCQKGDEITQFDGTGRKRNEIKSR